MQVSNALRICVRSRAGSFRPGVLPLSLFLFLALILVPMGISHAGRNGQEIKLVRLAPDKLGGNSAETQRKKPEQAINPAGDPGRFVFQQQQELLVLINQMRQSYGLPPFRYAKSLEASAHRHSSDMAQNNFVSHTGSDGSSPRKRMLDADHSLRSSAENVAAGIEAPGAVLTAWMRSPPHRANLLNANLRELGIGYAYTMKTAYRHYWTIDLACR